MKTLDSWHSYKKNLPIKKDTDLHPNSNGLKLDFFHSVSFESTEIEFLDLIHSLIISNNSKQILETGTHKGISTVAIAYALKNISIQNKNVELISLEKEISYANEARKRLNSCGLSNIAKVIESDTLSYLNNQSPNKIYDFVFFDSSRLIRPSEFDILHNRKLLKKNSLLIFHDTRESQIKTDPNDKIIQETYLKKLKQIQKQCKSYIIIPYSRGLSIFRY